MVDRLRVIYAKILDALSYIFFYRISIIIIENYVISLHAYMFLS
ncbi:hypothetical protein SAMN04488494_2612 [Xylanibacter ruminicola]|uniref:Uncharacterized protein n=1 Tax=Xylanibacter ruminicola TaxID=839 RepID=A0A1M7LLG6_XYLRU|nr:hypothetical protein SAMN04488494_2612 [Xylanibacter ruminicola]